MDLEEINKINKDYNIYILKVYGKNSCIIKLGYSSKIQERLKAYRCHYPLFDIISIWKLENAEEWEINFHKANKSILMNEWYPENMIDKITEELIISNAILFEDQPILIEPLDDFIKASSKTWITKLLQNKEYTYSELEIIFKDKFEKMGLVFNGFALKDYFPQFTKTRKTKNKIKETYYKFNF